MAAIASAGFIVNLTNMKTHLNINTSGQDDFLDMTLAAITKKFETYCKRVFVATTYTEYHSGNGRSGFFYINNPELIAISSLKEDSNRDFAIASLYDTSAYIGFSAEGRVELLSNADVVTTTLQPAVFGRGQQNIEIIYTGGFSDMPEDLQLGCKEWVSRLYHRRDKKKWSIQSYSKGDVSTSFETTGRIPDDIREMLDPYKIFGMGRGI